MAKITGRINIPANADAIIKLGQRILAKHQADGDASPLRDLKMAEFKKLVALAESENEKGKDFRRKAEHCTEIRDSALGAGKTLAAGTVRYCVASARDVLAGLYKGQEHTLGEWGFEVDTSPRSPGKKKSGNVG